jgi:predicted oxidoreductase
MTVSAYNQNDVILGCMHLGGRWNKNPYTADEKQKAFKTLDAAIENGIRRFDHADIYTFRKSEKIFGEWLSVNTALRSKIQIQTKAGIVLGKGANNSNYYRSDKNYLIEQCNASLKSLQTDYLDSFLIHRPDPYTHPEEIAETFRSLRSTGKVKHFGVSNMSAAQTKAIQNAWGEALVSNQLQLSIGHSQLVRREFFENTQQLPAEGTDESLLHYLQKHNTELQAWSPLDNGHYTKPINKNDEETTKQTKKLVVQLSEKYVCSKEAVVLAWIFKLPLKIAAVAGTGNPERIKACTEALHINLSHEDAYNLLITAYGEKLP